MRGLILAACLAHNSAYPINYVHQVEALEINHYGQCSHQIIVWETSEGIRRCQYWEACDPDAATKVRCQGCWSWYRLNNGDYLKAGECDETWSAIDREVADREWFPISKRKGLE